MGLLDKPVLPEVAGSIIRSAGYVQSGQIQNNTVWRSVASHITGWGFPIGPKQNVAKVGFYVRASVAGYIPTSVRVRIRQTDYTGTILGDATVTVVPTLGNQLWVTAAFTNITNAGAVDLWMEILTNGRIDMLSCEPITYTTPTARYWVDGNPSYPGSNDIATEQRNYQVTFYSQDYSSYTPELSSGMRKYVNRDTLLGLMATPSYTPSYTTTINTDGTVQYNTSSFFGWGQPLGNITTAIDAVGFYLYPFNESYPVTQIRLKIKKLPADSGTWGSTNPSAWEVLFDKTINVAAPVNKKTWIDVDLTSSGSLTGYLWLEFACNGRCAIINDRSVSIAAPPKTFYASTGTMDAPTWQEIITNVSFYCKLGTMSGVATGFVISNALKDQLVGSLPTTTATLFGHLPHKVYGLEGRETNIYINNLFRSTTPVDQLAVQFSCTVGQQFEREFRLTPTSGQAGSYTLSAAIKSLDLSNTITTLSTTYIVRALAYPASPVTRKLLVIGDSITDDGKYLAELVNLFNGDTKYTLTLVGRRTATRNDSAGNSRTIYHEGNGGWTLTDYYSGGSSPFLSAGSFSFSYYLSNNSITMSASDWVFIELGINDVSYSTDDVALQTKIDTFLTQLSAVITNIKAAVSGIRIGICLTIPPSISQSAFGDDYSLSVNLVRYKRNRDKLVEAVLAVYNNDAVTNVYLVPINLGLDTLFNMQTTSTQVNARNSLYYTRQTNAVHPAASGYYQIADQIRCFLKGIE